MENVINKYETIIVIDAALTDDEINATVEKFKGLIEANGTVESVDAWGKRKLAYPIDYKTEGYYVYMAFEGDCDLVQEMKRVIGIAENVIRRLITKR